MVDTEGEHFAIATHEVLGGRRIPEKADVRYLRDTSRHSGYEYRKRNHARVRYNRRCFANTSIQATASTFTVFNPAISFFPSQNTLTNLSMSCKHTILQLDPSPFAELAGYEQPDAATRAAAETTSGRVPKSFEDHSTQTFPAPLVLPHDELNYDPDGSGQSLKSWVNEKARNKLGNGDGRDTLYIARVPDISKEVEFMREWAVPNGIQDEVEMAEGGIESPDVGLFVEYLRAFYHDMDVRILPSPLSWTSWSSSKKAASRPSRRAALPKYVGLCDSSSKNTTRIRVRRPPDSFSQLN
jgi:hypothetical protein